MMNRLENAARQALEKAQPSFVAPEWTLVRNEDIAALREALEVNNKGVNALAEQPAQQEPVALLRSLGPKPWGLSWLRMHR